MKHYVRVAGVRSLKLLKRLKALERKPPYLFYRIPRVGPWLLEQMRKKAELLPHGVEREIWALEALTGKNEEDTFAILRDTAFPPKTTLSFYLGPPSSSFVTHQEMIIYDRMLRARELLALRWPDRWKDLMVENYDLMAYEDKLNLLPFHEMPMAGDARFARLVAEDKSLQRAGPPDVVLTRMNALADLYLLTKDKGAIATLEGYACDSSSFEAWHALRTLASIFSRDRGATDIPALIRTLIGDAAGSRQPARLHVARLAVYAMAESGCGEFLPLLTDILDRPENILGPNPDKETCTAMGSAAVEALGKIRSPSAVDVLVRCLDNAPPENSALRFATVTSLGLIGDERALPVLEKARRIEAARVPLTAPMQSATGDAPAPPYLSSDVAKAIPRAVALIHFQNAPDRGEWYAGLSKPEKDMLDHDDLKRYLTREELKALLADERCANARRDVIEAIVGLQ